MMLHALVLVLAVLQSPASVAPVVEYGDRRVVLDHAAWSKLPRAEFKAVDHEKPATFEGVLLRHVLALAGVPGTHGAPGLRGDALRLIVRIEATDGYQAVFALAELDPGFRDRPIFLVDRRDGQPLAADAGPFQVIAADEARAGRWVRQVARISVVTAGR